MNYILIALATLFNMACAQAPKADTATNMTISPGEVRWIEFPIKNNDSKLFCRDAEVKFVKKGKIGQAFVMESYFSDLSPFSCRIENEGNVFHEVKFTIAKRKYPAERLKVDQKKITLDFKSQQRADKEQLVLNKIYASSPTEFLFTDSFMPPMNSIVTSIYGTKRVYNNKKEGQHLGIDYRAAIGDNVPAANGGRVVLADDLFYTGWTVIIDHGLDIFTVYGHLSKTLVKQGEMIKRGDLIGLSGNTGRTSGPHLHWGTKVQGQYIDGFVLIEESKKYFNK